MDSQLNWTEIIKLSKYYIPIEIPLSLDFYSFPSFLLKIRWLDQWILNRISIYVHQTNIKLKSITTLPWSLNSEQTSSRQKLQLLAIERNEKTLCSIDSSLQVHTRLKLLILLVTFQMQRIPMYLPTSSFIVQLESQTIHSFPWEINTSKWIRQHKHFYYFA